MRVRFVRCFPLPGRVLRPDGMPVMYASFSFTKLAADVITPRVTAEGYQQPEPDVADLTGGAENGTAIYLEPIREEDPEENELVEQGIAPGDRVLRLDDGTLVLAPDEVAEE